MINIVLCTDEKYVPYCAVVVISTILHTSNPSNLNFYILTPGLNHDTSESIKSMASKYGANLEVITVEKIFSDDTNLDRFGHSSLLRLYMHKYLPKDLNHVIYLDCDLLILSDISELWDTNLNNYAVGAVTDLCSPKAYYERLKTYPDYCNSGVLLIDLNLWKEQQIGEKSLDYIRNNIDSLKYFDQDALNYVLNGNWLSLDLSWNSQSATYSAYENKYSYLKTRQTELLNAIQSPKIIHFIGGIKPWHANCKHPLQNLFIEFSKYTPWSINKKELFKKRTFNDKIRLLTRFLKNHKRRRMLKYKPQDHNNR